MPLKSFVTNDPNLNPFQSHISDKDFAYMLKQGFEKGTLNCYAPLTGEICYTKSFESSIGWRVNVYVTEAGIAVDHDYDCGGNSSHSTWWFEDGTFTVSDYGSKLEYTKSAHTFEDAWNAMIELSTSL